MMTATTPRSAPDGKPQKTYDFRPASSEPPAQTQENKSTKYPYRLSYIQNAGKKGLHLAARTLSEDDPRARCLQSREVVARNTPVWAMSGSM
jgi:hypothetical protein